MVLTLYQYLQATDLSYINFNALNVLLTSPEGELGGSINIVLGSCPEPNSVITSQQQCISNIQADEQYLSAEIAASCNFVSLIPEVGGVIAGGANANLQLALQIKTRHDISTNCALGGLGLQHGIC